MEDKKQNKLKFSNDTVVMGKKIDKSVYMMAINRKLNVLGHCDLVCFISTIDEGKQCAIQSFHKILKSYLLQGYNVSTSYFIVEGFIKAVISNGIKIQV